MPDATDDYRVVGWYHGKEYAISDSGDYYIWWDSIDTWTISTVLGSKGTDWWERTDPIFYGVYSPAGTATGDATVVVGKTP